jgi:hypothetical protein
MSKSPLWIAAALASTAYLGANVPAADPETPRSLTELDLHIEVDADTGAAELVLVLASDAPLASIALFDPDRREVLSTRTIPSTRVGLREVELELASAALPELLARFPEGTYVVRVASALAAPSYGEVVLDHALPGRFKLLEPADGELSAERPTISWSPSPGACGYSVELEDEASGFAMELVLPSRVTSFRVPAELLAAGGTYELSLTAQGDTDNETEIEGELRVEL